MNTPTESEMTFNNLLSVCISVCSRCYGERPHSNWIWAVAASIQVAFPYSFRLIKFEFVICQTDETVVFARTWTRIYNKSIIGSNFELIFSYSMDPTHSHTRITTNSMPFKSIRIRIYIYDGDEGFSHDWLCVTWIEKPQPSSCHHDLSITAPQWSERLFQQSRRHAKTLSISQFLHNLVIFCVKYTTRSHR